MQGASLQETAKFSVEEAVRITRSKVGYLAFLNRDETTLNMFSWSKGALDQCKMDERQVVFHVAETGLWGEAVRQRRPVITNDYAAPNQHKKGLPPGHVPLARHMNVPVFEGERIVAVAGVGNKETDYTESDVHQLTLLMDGMWQTLLQGQAIDALRQSEELHRLMFEDNPLPMYVYDQDTLAFLAVNDATVSQYGYSRAEFRSMTIKDIRPAEDMPRLTKDLFPSGSVADRRGIWRHRRKDGTVIEVEIITHDIVFNQRNARFVLANDVTQRRKMEQDLLKTQKLESLGVLAGGLAHDFNNLLTSILGNVSLVKAGVESSPAESERLQEAEKACFRARDLTQQLLTFSRGGAPLKEAISLNKVIIDSATFALRGSRSRCEFSIPPDLWPVEADEGQMSQVIQNMVMNADQAMPQGGIIQIHCRNVVKDPQANQRSRNGNYIEISIEDRGIGIPSDHLDKIFDPYFTTKQKGYGLGLATSYSIIKRHEGHITVESILGAGTTFHIHLPASLQQAREEHREESQVVPGSGRILIMDDEEIVRQVAGSMLRKLGYTVETARDGAEAVTWYAKAREEGRPFDLVIMDLTIPGGIGGIEALSLIRNIDPDIKAIVSSGYSNDPVMAEFRQYGFSGFVCKPYTLSALSKTVHSVLAVPGQARG